MPLPTISDQSGFTSLEREAYENGLNAGYDHANFIESYGATQDTEMPARFAEVATYWRSGYEEGMDAFAAESEDEYED